MELEPELLATLANSMKTRIQKLKQAKGGKIIKLIIKHFSAHYLSIYIFIIIPGAQNCRNSINLTADYKSKIRFRKNQDTKAKQKKSQKSRQTPKKSLTFKLLYILSAHRMRAKILGKILDLDLK